MTDLLFSGDSYLKTIDAKITKIENNAVITNRTIFYAESGGQPGDQGEIKLNDQTLKIIDTKKGSLPNEILHIVDGEFDQSIVGKDAELSIDWEKRYELMKMHTGCHILCGIIEAEITGASVGHQKSRIDFDVDPNLLNKEELNQKIESIIKDDHQIILNEISGDEFKNNPQLVKSAVLSPPVINNKVRTVQIGTADNIIDLQCCGGTHCLSTKELGAVEIGKIENKGKRNRRVNIRFKND
tara:strand:- start:3 stop:725 length:723 start_codon:yes stop_codon:yes gene_type:complete